MKLTRTHILTGLSIVFAIGLGTLLWQWEYSPLHKALALAALHAGSYHSTDEAEKSVRVLLNGKSLSTDSIGSIPFLPLDQKVTETIETSLPFETSTAVDPQFLEKSVYSFPLGRDGIFTVEHWDVSLEGRTIGTFQKSGVTLVPAILQVMHRGTLPQSEVEKMVKKNWATLVSSLQKNKPLDAESVLTAAEFERFEKTRKLSDLDYRLAPTPSVAIQVGAETDLTIVVGTITLKQKNCATPGTISVVYLKDQRSYRFDNVYAALSALCAKPKETSGTFTCSNCWLAPVGKKQALLSTYAPYVVSSGLNGGTYVTPDTKNALTKLFADAKTNGITTIRVSSGYRSYSWQESLFNTYVNNEKKYGLTTAQAVEKANTYSAKPGHSEHQLGTTVDLMACKSPCSFYDSANTPLFSYLNANAHKFGFAISYPNGSQPTTGYVYEPWHVRYIGTDLAIELYNRGYLTKKGYYLEQFLREKGRY